MCHILIVTYHMHVHHPMSVTYRIAFVMCQVSGVTYHKEKMENWWGLSVEGLLSTGHKLSMLYFKKMF